jgi:quinol monooxygenase YgiN
MVIVAGEFQIKPEERDEFLAGRLDSMRASRAEPGNLEYTMSADPIDPGRIVLFERWADQASLDTHIAALANAPRPTGPAVAPTSATITVYDIAGERPLGI